MDCDSGTCEHGWHYDDPRTTAGALQRGLGRGAGRALDDLAGPSLVIDCLRRDYRWDRQVDERAVYLARLIRDLHMPVEKVLEVWLAAPDRDADHDNVFDSVLDVLQVLGRTGDDTVVQPYATRSATTSGGPRSWRSSHPPGPPGGGPTCTPP